MSKRRHSRPASRRRALARPQAIKTVYRRSLRYEPLEDRRLLAVVTVDTLADTVDFNDGHTSLREAIFATNTVLGADTINFAPALTANGPATILLKLGELKITDALTINGPGSGLFTIDASGNDPTPDINDGKGSRVLTIDDGTAGNLNVQLTGLRMTGGDVRGSGGAILNRESLSLSNVLIEQNCATDYGGGISNQSILTMLDCKILSNSANGVFSEGGGISSRSGDLTVMNSDIQYNSAVGSGGGIDSQSGNLTVQGSVIRFNSGSSGGGVNLDSGISSNTATLTSDVISDNTASEGGGVSVQDANTTVTACTITGNKSKEAGGGLRVTKGLDMFSSVNITGSTISENTAGTSGGAVACAGFSRGNNYLPITLTNCTISGNHSGTSYEGGGIQSYGCRLTVNGCEIIGNVSDVGGGIRTIFGSLAVLGTEITANSAGGRGGGIESSSTTVVLATSRINQNSAGVGGGIYNAGSLNITDCAIEDNHALFDGGGIHGGAVIARSTISGNTAGGNGGGIYGSYYTDISNSTISGNVANGSGGGIWAHPLQGSIISSTITQNTALIYGGGVFVETGELKIDDSIIASNTAYRIGNDLTGLQGANFEPRYSLIGSNANSGLSEAPLGSPDANGNIIGGSTHGSINPGLGPLAENGGIALPGGGHVLTHSLLPSSPAINAGDPTANGVPTNDQRGAPFTRVYGGRIDMGAVESQPNPLPGDFNFNGVVDMADYALWRKALTTSDPRADANGDGRINDADLAVWRANFGNTYASVAAAALAVVPSIKEPANLELIRGVAPVNSVAGPGTAGIELPVAVLPPSICPTSDAAPVEPVVDSSTARAALPVAVLAPGVCPTPDVARIKPVVDSSIAWAAFPVAVLPPGLCPTPAGTSTSVVDEALSVGDATVRESKIVGWLTDSIRQAAALDQAFAMLGA